MSEKLKIEVATTEDGELWGIFTYQPVNISDITYEAILEALLSEASYIGLDDEEFDIEYVKQFKIKHMAFKQGHDQDEECSHDNDDCDCSFYWCGLDDPKAIRVTGIKIL